MEVNAATSRLLEMIRSNSSRTVTEILTDLASELGMEANAVMDFGSQQLEELVAQSIVWLTSGSNAAGDG